MNEKKLPMGTSFNCHFGHIKMPSQILEVGIFDDCLQVECEDGYYKITKEIVSEERLIIKKTRNK